MKKFTLILILMITQNAATAANFIVDRFEDAPDDFPGNGICKGLNMVGATCSLRAAIMEANATPGPHTILVPAGNDFVLNRVGEDDSGLNGDLDITEDITLINGTSGFVVDGNGLDRLFHVHADGVLTINNATLKNGVANTATTFQGGAVRVEDNGAFIADEVIFVNNLANRGGALFNDGEVLIENSYFHHNAITDENTPQNLDAVGSTILNRNLLLFATSTVSHNGTLLDNPGQVSMAASQYAMHFNPNGQNATPPSSFVFNSTIANNGYAGIRSDRGFTDINQSTIANHETQGIRFTRNDNHPDVLQLKIRKSLFVNHGFKDCNDLWVLPVSEADLIDNHNASTDESCGFSGSDDYENIADPLNGSLHDWGGFAPTLMLNPTSIVIDHAGDDCTAEDQRGSLRPLDGNENQVATCDIGAVEFNPNTDPMVSDVIFKDGLND
ncbi:choice-of-anchor Q domain-containing protein [Marinicella sediminis]|uniref:Choice-of-anchor Q domain-containing protein n=1 Tax=Marinicella sediminis TaxID=1792834 RepID=A0ABV7JBT7_9GAMM|nr:choice-of-anchor Q domain-containing protein [Marinicella sediminis]